ncbi:MAG TPA: hypothetical protein VF018_08930 [Acidobacteriaceae bacterium]
MLRRWFALLIPAMLCGLFAAAQQPSGWQTYSNPDYGFIISYPPDIKLYNNSRGERPSGFLPICSALTVACLGYTGTDYRGTNLEGAGVAINVLRDAKTEQDCDTLESPLPSKITIIHGVPFHTALISDAGLSHNTSGPAYRAFYQNVCFEVASLIASSSFAAFETGSLKEFHPDRLSRLLDQVVHTFRFTGPVKDGADWKVSRDSGCGGIFEYPASDTIRVLAEYTNGAENSERITCSRAFTHKGRNYTLAAKIMSSEEYLLDRWLKASDYPTLDNAKVVSRSHSSTDYIAPPYYYVHAQTMVFIFSVSGPDGHPIPPGEDPIYRHWLASFKVP